MDSIEIAENNVLRAFALNGSISFNVSAERIVEAAHRRAVATERTSPSMTISHERL